MSNVAATRRTSFNFRQITKDIWAALKMPMLAILMAFIIGALVIWITEGSLVTVGEAYYGLLRGAFFKQRGFSETLVATIPYVLLSLAVTVGFKTGLFNIGVEGQFTIGSICAAWAGVAFSGLPGIIHLPLTILTGALGGMIWAVIPGYLKARTGAHEVISTMMMNYVAFRLGEYMVSYPLRDHLSSGVQTLRISPEAELWTMSAFPQQLQNPLNALLVAIIIAVVVALSVRTMLAGGFLSARVKTATQRRTVYLVTGLVFGVIAFVALPPLTQAWWPFTDQYDRLHTGIFLAIFAAIGVWWLMWKTTLGFELRMVGANPNAAQYAGVNITRNIVVAMAISGALAGIAGTVEVIGVSICRCLPLFFSSGYGWDSIGIALLAKNNPFGILAASLLFGAMRNGADLMELTSGVSKYIISLIQALVLLFVAAPAIVRYIYRMKDEKTEAQASLTTGWGGRP
ncbi:MAG: ABC transporter permease [Anaerolineales bacterium]|nr:ABC transporter permease [Anaerolineales bacterium]